MQTPPQFIVSGGLNWWELTKSAESDVDDLLRVDILSDPLSLEQSPSLDLRS